MSLLLLGTRGMRRRNDPLLQFLPPGMTLHADTSFDAPWNGTVTVGGYYVANDTTGGISRREDTSGGYGPWVTRFSYAEGSVSNGAGVGTIVSALDAPSFAWRQYYLGLRHRFSANYRTHTNAYTEKFVYPTYNGAPTTQAPLIQVVGQDPTTRSGPFALVTYEYPNGPSPVGFRFLTPYVIAAGAWADIAIHHVVGDPGEPNSAFTVWIDGEMVGHEDDVVSYLGSTTLTVDRMRYDTTRGGGPDGLPVPAGGMWRELDRMVLYGSTT